MIRAPKICSSPGCPNIQPCPEHFKEPWAGSTREGRALTGRRRQRRNREVMMRHSGKCHVCGQYGADEVDHVVPLAEGGPDSSENLRPIHATPCHEDKTAGEAQRARSLR